MTAGEVALRAGVAGRGVGLLWRFSRPHTIVGTALSVLGLYVIAAAESTAPGAFDLGWTLVAAFCVNVFIVGLNQLEDIELDRVNKPRLPLAAGDLSVPAGRAIVAVAGVLPVVLAITQGPVELVAVLVAMAAGVAYSSPPLRLKRRPVLAALLITSVRAVVVNLGVYAHFAGTIPAAVWALTLFVLPFSFAIAILKDVPDIEGDRRFGIATFSVRLGPERVLALGLAALTVAYLGMAIGGPLFVDGAQPVVLALGHVLLLAVAWRWARTVDVHDRVAFTRFYMGIWGLFFAEYVLVPAAVVLG